MFPRVEILSCIDVSFFEKLVSEEGISFRDCGATARVRRSCRGLMRGDRGANGRLTRLEGGSISPRFKYECACGGVEFGRLGCKTAVGRCRRSDKFYILCGRLWYRYRGSLPLGGVERWDLRNLHHNLLWRSGFGCIGLHRVQDNRGFGR